MAESTQWSDAELEQALVALGTRISFPATPDLAANLSERLAARPVARRPTVGARILSVAPIFSVQTAVWKRVAFGSVALVVLAALLVLLSPSARSAIAGRLGLRGVSIKIVATTPTQTPPVTPGVTLMPLGSGLNLGLPVSRTAAQAHVSYQILLPSLPELGVPGAIFLDQTPPGGEVSLVYAASPSLPETPETGVGLLFSEFRGDIGPNLFGKGLPPGTTIEPVMVNGSHGWWIAGAPHFFVIYTDAAGQTRGDETRLAGNVLIWEQGGLTLRLESALSKDEALRVAASVR